MRKLVLLVISVFFLSRPVFPQDKTLFIRGLIQDSESGAALAGAYVTELNSSPVNGTISNESGKFSLPVKIGRVSLKITFLGYEDAIIRDILVSSGKEVVLSIGMHERVVQTTDVIVRSGRRSGAGINQMATISTTTIRPDDALRYAGGFYDPSRIVNSFAGIISSNSDYSNDLVIRGNSSRGLLWKLEGIEIPNPNHFSDGQGGSGGAFSAITSNVVDNFSFFTGAFPAEFGNAISGVMDLSLRKGNSSVREYAFQTGMIGAELSFEGPFSKTSDASYLFNGRYTNFSILNKLGLIDLEESNYAPRTMDVAVNINVPMKKTGTLNLFGFSGRSEIGKIADHDFTKWNSLSDRWEEMEMQSSTVAGIRHLYTFPELKTSIKNTLAYTGFKNTFREGYIDSTYVSHNSYSYSYDLPTARYALTVNHKINAGNSFRTGLILNFMQGEMENLRELPSGDYDTLVGPSSSASMTQAYFQWKTRPFQALEINSGFHMLHFSMNGQLSFEPRIGLRCALSPGNFFVFGLGVHSRAESLAVYNSLIRQSDGSRELSNQETGLSKAFHLISGLDLAINENLFLKIEGYFQHLFNVPIVNKMTSQYSTLNSAERLPDAMLENKGTGRNSGVELTLEKSFSRNYYFLLTGSLFNSWYIAGDQRKYNTYYNTRYAGNLLAGKDFYTGRNKRNSFGLNAKLSYRGGYRYTPVDVNRSLKAGRIIYSNWRSYESQLPDYFRLDAGINFRRNHPGYSWIIMLDVQNLTDRSNVFRRRFYIENKKIIETDILSLGIVPVFNFRIEF